MREQHAEGSGSCPARPGRGLELPAACPDAPAAWRAGWDFPVSSRKPGACRGAVSRPQNQVPWVSCCQAPSLPEPSVRPLLLPCPLPWLHRLRSVALAGQMWGPPAAICLVPWARSCKGGELQPLKHPYITQGRAGASGRSPAPREAHGAWAQLSTAPCSHGQSRTGPRQRLSGLVSSTTAALGWEHKGMGHPAAIRRTRLLPWVASGSEKHLGLCVCGGGWGLCPGPA